MDIGVGEFTIIEAFVYMLRIDVRLPVLVRLDSSPFLIRFPSFVWVSEKMHAKNWCFVTFFGTFGQESLPNQISMFGMGMWKDVE